MVDSDVLTAVSKAVHTALNVPYIPEFKENNMTFPCAYIKLIEPSMGDMSVIFTILLWI